VTGVRISIAIGVFGVLSQAWAAPNRDYKLEERETTHHAFTNDNTLDVDDVNGAITVIGDGGNTIRVDAEKIIKAADAEEMARGKREVVLDVNEKGGVAQLYVNGPFRDNDHRSEDHGFHDHREREYEVIYNLTIHVPRATALQLRTVNGRIDTTDTTGTFDLHGVNGAVKMTNAAGSGTTQTVNGEITAVFRENPKGDLSFKTVNGRVEVSFPPSLSADLQLKTFNGSAYTDFDATALASPPGQLEQKNGRFVYRTNRFSNVRVGSGGPVLKFETLNGNIQIGKLAR
jgi:hypothetical protein